MPVMRIRSVAILCCLLLSTAIACDFEAEVGGGWEDPETPTPVGDPTEEVNPSRSTMSSMPACGSALASWNGSTAYSNGPNTGTGYSCGGGGKYGLQYQCVELVMRHFMLNWNLRWYGNAKDLLNNAPKAQVDVYYNGDGSHPPVPGDMIVWTKGTYGHVALVTSVTSSSVDIIEQNVTGKGAVSLSYDGKTVGTRWGSWEVSGWAHAKSNPAKPGTTTPPPTPPPSTPTWDCSKSSQAGKQVWTCSGGSRNKCDAAGKPLKEDCTHGCLPGSNGSEATCAPAPSNPNPTNPINWNCVNSSYKGQQVWTCSGGSRYKCDASGKAQKETCSYGCVWAGLGVDDYCASNPSGSSQVNWSCSKSAYQGKQIWTCSNGNIYKCDSSGKAVMTSCSKGCNVMPLGTDDTCK